MARLMFHIVSHFSLKGKKEVIAATVATRLCVNRRL